MQDEDGCLRGDRVDFFEGGHAALGELKLTPAADDAHPLAGRSALCLLFQHAQAVREGRNAIPTKLQVVTQPAANDVHVRIVQPRYDAAALEVNDARVRPAFITLGVVHADDFAICNGDVARLWIF